MEVYKMKTFCDSIILSVGQGIKDKNTERGGRQ